MQGKLKNSLLSGQHGAWLKTRVLLLSEKRKNKLEGTVDSLWHNKHSKRPSAERALSKGVGVFASILSVRIVCSYRHHPGYRRHNGFIAWEQRATRKLFYSFPMLIYLY